MKARAAAFVLVGLILMLAVAFLLAAPLVAEAQERAIIPRIGYLMPRSPTSFDEVFRAEVRNLGYIEGQSINIEYRFSGGKHEVLPVLAAELVRLKVDIIVATMTAIHAAKAATSTTPIVMAISSDPIGEGLVASLARPGGNITGLSVQGPDFTAKRLELLRETFPKVLRVAALWNADNPGMAIQFKEAEAAARRFGLHLRSLDVRSVDDLERAFGGTTLGDIDAIIVLPDGFTLANRERIVDLAARTRRPAMYWNRAYAEAGGLMSYGPNVADSYRRAAAYVHKILKGAKPADLPVEQPTKFELIINLKTAKPLGLTIPPSLLLRADQMLE